MLTKGGPAVDGERVTQAQLARIKGVTKQAISKRWKRLKEEGLLRPTVDRGRETVRLAEWDTVVGETTEPARLLPLDEAPLSAPPPSADPAADRDPGYTHERTRQARYEADLKEIRLKRERGELLEIGEATNAMSLCAEAIVRDLDQLPAYADELAAAFAQGGVSALRDGLKKVARRVRETLAQNMRLLTNAADEDEDEEAGP